MWSPYLVLFLNMLHVVIGLSGARKVCSGSAMHTKASRTLTKGKK